MDCRVLKNGKCKIFQNYNNTHQAIDIIGENNGLDYVIAHSDGIVNFYQDGYGNMKGSTGNLSYGNSIKIDHQNGYHTLYAHMKNDLSVSLNQFVKKGQIIGYISDSGNAYGEHLHFEVWKDNKRINPLEFLNKDFFKNEQTIQPVQQKQETPNLQYKVGDTVEINGVYTSSTSNQKLRPLITKGKITRIIENANNPYLLEEGRIGWINNNVIISKIENRYLSNKTYQGTSLVDALKQIGVDSSFTYRSNLATINNINNYKGTTEQNIKMLNLLKQGLLKY